MLKYSCSNTYRAFKQLLQADFQTPAQLCKGLNKAGTLPACSLKSLSSLLDRYPAIFLRSSAHVFLNPVQTVLLSQLLPLATNAEAVVNSVRLVVRKMSPSFAIQILFFRPSLGHLNLKT